MEIDKNKEKIKLQFDIIKRTDGYISTTNNKSALLLAANGATATIFLNKIDAFSGLFHANKLYVVVNCLLIFMAVLFIFLSVFYALRSIIPKVTAVKKGEGITDSLVSFVYIAKNTTPDEYYLKYEREVEADLLRDMCRQSFILAGIAEQKFSFFSTAVAFIKATYVCIALLAVMKFIDYANGVLL